jgi:hypothetical protein
MLSLLLVFAHLLAASMALGAIVATDLRLLSKLAQDRTRIAPPNEFVARIVVVALVVLYATGAAIVWQGVLERPDYLANPKLQAKLALVVLLTINAFVLHRLTFPRLARGRRVARWHASDWIVIGIPVGISNFLWMFVAFLGVARAWNGTISFGEVMAVAAIGYGVAQGAVFAILAVAASGADPIANPRAAFVRRRLASLGNLGRPLGGEDDQTPLRHETPLRDVRDDGAAAAITDAIAGALAERRAQPMRGRRPVTG